MNTFEYMYMHSLIKSGYTTFLSHCKDERAKLYLFSNSPVIVVKVYLKRQIAYKIQIADENNIKATTTIRGRQLVRGQLNFWQIER